MLAAAGVILVSYQFDRIVQVNFQDEKGLNNRVKMQELVSLLIQQLFPIFSNRSVISCGYAWYKGCGQARGLRCAARNVDHAQ